MVVDVFLDPSADRVRPGLSVGDVHNAHTAVLAACAGYSAATPCTGRCPESWLRMPEMADPDDPLRRRFEQLEQLRGGIISAAILVESHTTWLLETCLFGGYQTAEDGDPRDRVRRLVLEPMSQSERIRLVRATLDELGWDSKEQETKQLLHDLERANEIRNTAAHAAFHYSWDPHRGDSGPQDSRFLRVQNRRGTRREDHLLPELLSKDKDFIEELFNRVHRLQSRITLFLTP